MWQAISRGSANFWLTLVANLALLGGQAVYWRWMQPVNHCWLQGEPLRSLSADFFS